jgi:hypothetical protein
MSDPPKRRLKGFVRVSRTVQPRRFESSRLDLAEEFWMDEKTHDEVLAGLLQRIDRFLGS